MKNKLIIAVLIASIGVFLFSTSVLAQGAENGQNQRASLIQKLADKFGLKKEDVQSVFDQHRTEMQAAMQAKFTAQLDQYEKDGKITEAQKKLILEKHKEIQAQRQSEIQNLQNKTPEERRAAMEARRAQLEKWAQDNGIDLQYFGGFGKHGGMMGFGKFR